MSNGHTTPPPRGRNLRALRAGDVRPTPPCATDQISRLASCRARSHRGGYRPAVTRRSFFMQTVFFLRRPPPRTIATRRAVTRRHIVLLLSADLTRGPHRCLIYIYRYDPDDLLFFLYVRSVIQKLLNVTFRARWGSDALKGGGPDRLPKPLWLSYRECVAVARTVFGTDGDPMCVLRAACSSGGGGGATRIIIRTNAIVGIAEGEAADDRTVALIEEGTKWISSERAAAVLSRQDESPCRSTDGVRPSPPPPARVLRDRATPRRTARRAHHVALARSHSHSLPLSNRRYPSWQLHAPRPLLLFVVTRLDPYVCGAASSRHDPGTATS